MGEVNMETESYYDLAGGASGMQNSQKPFIVES
jgi:hypothetical protein